MGFCPKNHEKWEFWKNISRKNLVWKNAAENQKSEQWTLFRTWPSTLVQKNNTLTQSANYFYSFKAKKTLFRLKIAKKGKSDKKWLSPDFFFRYLKGIKIRAPNISRGTIFRALNFRAPTHFFLILSPFLIIFANFCLFQPIFSTFS